MVTSVQTLEDKFVRVATNKQMAKNLIKTFNSCDVIKKLPSCDSETSAAVKTKVPDL